MCLFRSEPGRASRLFFRRRLLVARPVKPKGSVHSTRWPDKSRQFHKTPTGSDAAKFAGSGIGCSLVNFKGQSVCPACSQAFESMVPGSVHKNEPKPAIRAGDN